MCEGKGLYCFLYRKKTADKMGNERLIKINKVENLQNNILSINFKCIPLKFFFMKTVNSLFATIVILLACTSKLVAQCDTHLLPLPTMFVDKVTTDERNLEFIKPNPSKYKLLASANGSQDVSMVYSQAVFEKLFKKINDSKGVGIRIYFARFKKCRSSQSPATIKENQIILLFAQEDASKKFPSEFYFVNENDEFCYSIQPSCATVWIDNFNRNNGSDLKQTIDSEDIDNADPVNGYSDTRSIFFTKGQIDSAFALEECYQASKFGSEIVAYKVSFAAYTKDGDLNGRFKKRLHLEFEYLHIPNSATRKMETLYLDDTKDYIQRKAFTKKKFFNDNGQLCPTNCPEEDPPLNK